MRTGPFHILLIAAALMGSSWLWAAARVTENVPSEQDAAEEVPRPADGGATPAFRYVGTASCAAANCHGGDGARPALYDGDPLSPQAYSVWIQTDPHAQAYSTLLGEESREIAARLGWDSAHTAQVCLDCHAIGAASVTLAPIHRHTLHDGVSCEACHGAAEQWLEPHKWASWAALSPQRKRQLGFRDLDDLTVRAEACTTCHIGDGQRDVNHQLIAAGHPRLSFELSAYHANLPKHWRNEATSKETLDTRLWLLGQVESAAARLELLSQRASSPDASWPEFAEYSCFACHHDLAEPSWRQQRGLRPGAPAGSFVWETWYFPLLSVVADDGWSALETPLAELRAAMSVASPNRQRVNDLIPPILEQLRAEGDTLSQGPLAERDLSRYLQRVAAANLSGPYADWDREAQRFLAAAAIYHSVALSHQSQGRPLPGRWLDVADQLRNIRHHLSFYQADDVLRYNSPRRMTPTRRQAVSDAFAALHEAGSQQ